MTAATLIALLAASANEGMDIYHYQKLEATESNICFGPVCSEVTA